MNIAELIRAMRAGYTLKNPGTWANATAATSALAALAWAAVQIAAGFGYALPITQDQATILAGAFVSVVGVFAPVLHIATNPAAGLPAIRTPGARLDDDPAGTSGSPGGGPGAAD